MPLAPCCRALILSLQSIDFKLSTLLQSINLSLQSIDFKFIEVEGSFIERKLRIRLYIINLKLFRYLESYSKPKPNSWMIQRIDLKLFTYPESYPEGHNISKGYLRVHTAALLEVYNTVVCEISVSYLIEPTRQGAAKLTKENSSVQSRNTQQSTWNL